MQFAVNRGKMHVPRVKGERPHEPVPPVRDEPTRDLPAVKDGRELGAVAEERASSNSRSGQQQPAPDAAPAALPLPPGAPGDAPVAALVILITSNHVNVHVQYYKAYKRIH